MNCIVNRTSTGLKSLSFAGFLALSLAAGLAPGFTAIPASAQQAAGNGGGGNNPGGGSSGNPGGDGGNANYGPAPWAAAIQCEGPNCPPPYKQKPAPVVQVPFNQQCGGQQIRYDSQGRVIRQDCPQQLTQAQLNKLRH